MQESKRSPQRHAKHSHLYKSQRSPCDALPLAKKNIQRSPQRHVMYIPCSIETSQVFGGNNASEKYSGSKKKVQVVRINTQPAKTWDALPPAKKRSPQRHALLSWISNRQAKGIRRRRSNPAVRICLVRLPMHAIHPALAGVGPVLPATLRLLFMIRLIVTVIIVFDMVTNVMRHRLFERSGRGFTSTHGLALTAATACFVCNSTRLW